MGVPAWGFTPKISVLFPLKRKLRESKVARCILILVVSGDREGANLLCRVVLQGRPVEFRSRRVLL